MPLSGSGLASLRDLPKLAALRLNETGINDAALEHLRGLKHLTRLELRQTLISDAAVDTLVTLRGLKLLDISETAITEVGRKTTCRRPAAVRYYPLVYETTKGESKSMQNLNETSRRGFLKASAAAAAGVAVSGAVALAADDGAQLANRPRRVHGLDLPRRSARAPRYRFGDVPYKPYIDELSLRPACKCFATRRTITNITTPTYAPSVDNVTFLGGGPRGGQRATNSSTMRKRPTKTVSLAAALWRPPDRTGPTSDKPAVGRATGDRRALDEGSRGRRWWSGACLERRRIESRSSRR